MTIATDEIVIHLGGIVFDSATADADGIHWCAQEIDGWRSSADLDTNLGVAPIGDIITNNRMKSRALTLAGTATADGIGHRRLGVALYGRAERSLKRAMRFEYLQSLLQVIEPEITLQAYVRRANQAIRMKMVGEARVLQFEIPLIAEDPRRYSGTLTTDTQLGFASGSGTSDSATIVNNGDQPSAPIITLTQGSGSSVNPSVINDSEAFGLFYTGTLAAADVLVLDCGAKTAKLNGVDVMPALDHFSPPSVFWDLQPGNNACRLLRSSASGGLSCSIAYRDAYS